MENGKFYTSLKITFIWIFLFVIFEIVFLWLLEIFSMILIKESYPYIKDLDYSFVFNYIHYCFIFLTILLSSYIFLIKNSKKSYFLFSIFIFLSFEIIYSLFYFSGSNDGEGLVLAFWISTIISKTIFFLFILIFNLIILVKNNFEFSNIFIKINKYFCIIYLLFFIYLNYNTLIFLLAKKTNSVFVCNNLTAQFLNPLTLQVEQHRIENGFLYPDDCLVEIAKNGFDSCFNLTYQGNGKCYLELSLAKKDVSICEKISKDNPPVYYMSCIFRMENRIFNNESVERCMYPDYIEQDYGKIISFKECVKRKYRER